MFLNHKRYDKYPCPFYMGPCPVHLPPLTLHLRATLSQAHCVPQLAFLTGFLWFPITHLEGGTLRKQLHKSHTRMLTCNPSTKVCLETLKHAYNLHFQSIFNKFLLKHLVIKPSDKKCERRFHRSTVIFKFKFMNKTAHIYNF